MTVRKTIEFKMGAKGPEIREIRKMLAKLGSTIKPGDKFDIGMRSAVHSFQRKHGLPATGIVDKKTLDCLTKMTAPKAKKATAKSK